MTRRNRRGLLWAAFGVGHAWLALLGLALRPESTYDVELYRRWADSGINLGLWPVLDEPWVYPVGALAPVLVGAPVSTSPLAYATAWFALVTALDAVAVLVLLRATRHGEVGAWWWMATLVALGPVALGRLDGVVAPLTVVALVAAARRPAVASALLTFGAWVKVSPGAGVVALLATARRPVRSVLLPAAVVTAVVAGLALTGGAGPRLLSFLGAQGGRGLQVEAVAATPYSLARLAGVPVWAELDARLNTYEIAGADTTTLTRALDVALVTLVVAIGWLAWRAARDVPGRRAGPAPRQEILLVAAFALQLALVVANKVGSPQFVSWLLPPVAVALASHGWRGRWRRRALLLLAVAALTQWIFPLDYWAFLTAEGSVVVGAAVRNGLLVVLLVTSVRELVRRGGRPRAAASVAE